MEETTSLDIWVDGVGVEAGLALERGRQVLHAQLRAQPRESAMLQRL